jgi:hypothetical protein
VAAFVAALLHLPLPVQPRLELVVPRGRVLLARVVAERRGRLGRLPAEVVQQEVVVRPLEDPLVRVVGVSGSTDLGDGRPTLVLDLVALSSSLSEAAA